jgi:hypothetical protein
VQVYVFSVEFFFYGDVSPLGLTDGGALSTDVAPGLIFFVVMQQVYELDISLFFYEDYVILLHGVWPVGLV